MPDETGSRPSRSYSQIYPSYLLRSALTVRVAAADAQHVGNGGQAVTGATRLGFVVEAIPVLDPHINGGHVRTRSREQGRDVVASGVPKLGQAVAVHTVPVAVVVFRSGTGDVYREARVRNLERGALDREGVAQAMSPAKSTVGLRGAVARASNALVQGRFR